MFGYVGDNSRTITLCSDTRTKMVDHQMCSLTLAFSHIDHVDNIAEDRSVSQSGSISRRCLWIVPSFSVNSANIAINHLVLKTKSFRPFSSETLYVYLQLL